MRRSNLTGVALLTATVVTVMTGLAGVPAQAVIDADKVNTASPWAALVTTVSGGTLTQQLKSSCTGTVVAEGWVLTAAHCVSVPDESGQATGKLVATSEFRVVLGRSNL